MHRLKVFGYGDSAEPRTYTFSTAHDAGEAERATINHGSGIARTTVEMVHSLNGKDVDGSIVSLIRAAGRPHLIQSIKAVRALTGADLKNSKDFCEAVLAGS